MKQFFIFLFTLILLALLFVGCGGKDNNSATNKSSQAITTINEPATSSVSTTSTTSIKTSTALTTSTSVKTTIAPSNPGFTDPVLYDLYSKASSVKNYYCEIKTTTPTSGGNMKQWVKMGNSPRFKIETVSAEGSVPQIYDGKNVYAYYPQINAWMILPEDGSSYALSYNIAMVIAPYNPTPMGSETVNGVDCYVYQFTADGVTNKYWIWKQYGLTVKNVSSVLGGQTMEYSNFNFDAIADSMFQLPPGAMITTFPKSPF